LKATPLLFAPVFFWQWRLRAAAIMIATLAAVSFLPDLLYPAQSGVPWVVTWRQQMLGQIELGETAKSATGCWGDYVLINQSLAGSCSRLFSHGHPDVCIANLSPTARKGATLVAQLLTVGWLWWITRTKLTRGLPQGEAVFLRLGQGAAVLTAMMLLSPTSIKTNFCGLIVPIAFCTADFLYRLRDWFVGLSLFVVFGLGTFTVRAVLDEAPAGFALACGSITWLSVAVFFATGRIVLQRSKAASAANARITSVEQPDAEGASPGSPGAAGSSLARVA
jgi:hypothetical protein